MFNLLCRLDTLPCVRVSHRFTCFCVAAAVRLPPAISVYTEFASDNDQ